MRITSTAKQQTRARILGSAQKLFAKQGFENTTTRDIAAAAEIASGTVFNYFPTKEALAMTLVAEALDTVRDEFDTVRSQAESLDEALFGYVMTGLRQLKPFRPYLAQVFESAMSPFARTCASDEAERIRTEHLETVGEIIRHYSGVREPSFVAMHLYWSLYLGVLAFWSHDESPNQEETLVVLDQATRLFMQSLGQAEMKSRPEIDSTNGAPNESPSALPVVLSPLSPSVQGVEGALSNNPGRIRSQETSHGT